MDVEEVAEELYGLRPAEFVAARDTYVARARAAKDARAAKAIAALRRPSLAAWAANRLARQRQPEAQQFLALGETLREAHRTLDAEQLRAASGQRQQLITALARTAGALAGEAGLSVSDTVLHEIEQTLHGVLADRHLAEQWSRGRLVKTPEAVVGFPPVAPEAVPAARAPAAATPEATGTAGTTGATETAGTTATAGTATATDSEEAAGAAEQPAPKRRPARGADARRRRELERARVRELERARTAAEEADGEVALRERELAEARDARQAAAEAAEEAAERVSRLEHELHDGRKARQEARTASTTAGKAVTTAEHALRDARRAAAQAAGTVQDLEGRNRE
ncbi:hypothetical protein MBT42_32960 [Streptomyces sp. MBT42]|uniref:hypothetical protein n=1 Tax=Streptomyces sp. MBT42 TaxID=1488373 RepID=UPI001E4C445D|nr:hypothetical protein [Streptomyces sp. MBT42]MCD2468350.1 hypothetical protein [Streptomyces sp. MBT42]